MGLGAAGAGHSEVLRAFLRLEPFRQGLNFQAEAFLQGKFGLAFRPFDRLDEDQPHDQRCFLYLRPNNYRCQPYLQNPSMAITGLLCD